jgi:hypothetical protein
MTCLEARRELAADPGQPSDALRRHVAECDACARALWREQGFDRRLREALSVPAPDELAERLLLTQTTRHRRRLRRPVMALAASLVLALALGVTWQLGVRPVSEAQALNQYVAAHLDHEPQSLTTTTPVNLGTVEKLLNDYGLHLSGEVGNIVYAKRCPTPNGTGLHLVVRTAEGPMTFLYMPEQRVTGRVDLEANGHQGYVTAFGDGAAALVGTPSDALQAVGERLANAIRHSDT